MAKIYTSAVIVAAGTGKRMKSSVSKQFIEINSKPVAAYTIERFEEVEEVDEIIVVTGEEDIDYLKKEIVEKYNMKKVKAVVAGGSERQYSVYSGLRAVSNKTDIVLIHDGVRPFVRGCDIKNIIGQTRVNGACVLGVKVKDTIKMCNEDAVVVDTPKREVLWCAHTPQSFKYDIIMKAHEKAQADNFLGTDDSVLAERIGYKIKMVEGSYDNIKITTPEDLVIAKQLIQ